MPRVDLLSVQDGGELSSCPDNLRLREGREDRGLFCNKLLKGTRGSFTLVRSFCKERVFEKVFKGYFDSEGLLAFSSSVLFLLTDGQRRPVVAPKDP